MQLASRAHKCLRIRTKTGAVMPLMDELTAFGLAAVSAMLLFYALDRSSAAQWRRGIVKIAVLRGFVRPGIVWRRLLVPMYAAE